MNIVEVLNSIQNHRVKSEVIDKYKDLACYIVRAHLSQYGITTTACSFRTMTIAETEEQLMNFGYEILFFPSEGTPSVKLSKMGLVICENPKRFEVRIIRKVD